MGAKEFVSSTDQLCHNQIKLKLRTEVKDTLEVLKKPFQNVNELIVHGKLDTTGKNFSSLNEMFPHVCRTAFELNDIESVNEFISLCTRPFFSLFIFFEYFSVKNFSKMINQCKSVWVLFFILQSTVPWADDANSCSRWIIIIKLRSSWITVQKEMKNNYLSWIYIDYFFNIA